MELIRWALELGESVHGNTYEELMPLLDYYYDRDHLKAYCVANLLIDMDVADEHREKIELRRCIAAYYAGMYKVAKKHANELLLKYPDVDLYKNNLRLMEAYLNKEYDYCLFICPKTYGSFIDVARALKWRLEQEGNTAIISETILENVKNTIVFGAHTYAHNPNLLPKNAIIYNLEQLYEGSPYAHPFYLILLKDKEIWDYSKQNIKWLKQKGIGKEIKHVGMNYAPTLEIKKDAFDDEITEDIDILFIGALNSRRQAILDQLKAVAPNLNIVFKNNAWGIARNELIARSKIILNIHFYLSGILETPRVSYAVANKKFIISENSNPEDEMEWPGIVFTSYEKIIENILKYISLPEERIKLAEKAYTHFEANGSRGILSHNGEES
ncbi:MULTISPECIES: DNA-binding protein [Bacillus cereus group]|uniref:DNA-binding protein n=1 Tax=Bacillus cereus group TaxID=86661 RepID=UPI0008FDE8B0|nr:MULTISPECIES: DNA-binding protein [Bacillus cereus group]MDG1622532.1 glycosyltransferase family 1 protein [Bacillus mobilis]MDX5839251.1 glycosyltransferase family 1 protein [Bacillus cereus group sp. BfR-BA-01700]MED4387186.1 glycosyltransferase family 1 protein [Bacillus mobilis]OJE35685.1 DNA-binding protein [Bacillus mobilis]HDR7242947.1 glycosyltransferase family 1 protein [Bacillus mobilis]